MTDRRPTISAFPNPFPGNPYLTLFYDHLRDHGIDYVRSDYFGQHWLREQRGRIDFLHFHWPSFDYSDAQGNRSPIAMTKFFMKMRLARALGYRILWTMHNLYPHERQGRLSEWMCRFVFAQNVNTIFVTFPAARDDLRRHFLRKRGVHVVPHGNYEPVYPHRLDRGVARRQLGLPPDGYVFLVFGQVRPYKGADIAARALARTNDPDSRLYIVGQSKDEAHSSELRAIAARDPRVRLELTAESVPDDRVAMWIAACDCVAAPYREVYTSGVVYLAATFGKPIVAPRLGLFRSLLDQPFVLTFDPEGGDASAAEALAAARRLDPWEAARAAREFSTAHDWGRIAANAAEILKAAH